MADSCQCMKKPLQYCKVISPQLVKINEKKNKKKIKVFQFLKYFKAISLWSAPCIRMNFVSEIYDILFWSTVI